MHSILAVTLLLCVGCSYLEFLRTEEEPQPNCDPRTAFYPDQDGDGFGASDTVFVGCEAPSGYVETTGDCDDSDPSVIECPDTDPPSDTGQPGETGQPGDTSQPADTGQTQGLRG